MPQLPNKFILIHTAALAHEKNSDEKYIFDKNVKMVRNIINILSKRIIKLIFLSSVSVYGEDGNKSKIKVSHSLKPYNLYGKSKVKCEELIINSDLKEYRILRLAPVYDKNNLKDVKKE